VGASLLAIAVCQAMHMQQDGRNREQAELVK
jgi:hypothetical protein